MSSLSMSTKKRTRTGRPREVGVSGGKAGTAEVVKVCCFCGGQIEGTLDRGPGSGGRAGYIHPDCLSVTSVIYDNE